MANYLYGANVKSVQQFIFQTNVLKEIIGASEIVEEICTTFFKENVLNFNESKLTVSAAGNIRYIFENNKDCLELVRKFPKTVFSKAPGISFSQAVVEIQGNKPTHDENIELENRLRIQRNKVTPPTETGLRIIERSRRTGLPGIRYDGRADTRMRDSIADHRTGLPGIKYDDREVIDYSTDQKLKTYRTNNKLIDKLNKDNKIQYDFPIIIDEIESKSGYVAIIHADGNNMGKAIRAINEINSSAQDSIENNKRFSEAINNATLTAARTAINKTFEGFIKKDDETQKDKTVTIPMRLVIMGGDDFTVICNAEYALDLTRNYLAEFETESKKELDKYFKGMKPMTACAGIAFVKSSYPFHYGARLAEDLCKFSKFEAKQKNNDSVPSCLTFHRVLSSFVGEFSNDIIKRELTASAAGLNFCGGPYYISSYDTTVKTLLEMVTCLENKQTPGSKLREWISTSHVNYYLAKEDLQRIIQILEEKEMNDVVTTLDLTKLLNKLEQPSTSYSTLVKTSLLDAITLYSLTSKNQPNG